MYRKLGNPQLAIFCLFVLLQQISCNYLYIGGRFDGNQNSASSLKGSALYDLKRNSFQEIGLTDGEIRTSHYNPETKKLYVGGDFTEIGKRITANKPAVPANDLAKWNSSNSVWEALSPPSNDVNVFSGIFSNGTDTYIVGNMLVIAGQTTGAVAKYTSDANSTDPKFFQVGASRVNESPAVNVVTVYKDNVIIGGAVGISIQKTVVETVNGLAIVQNGGDWNELANGVCGGEVKALAVFGNVLYVGGSFTHVNGSCGVDGILARGIASLNLQTNTWSNMGANLPAGAVVRGLSIPVNATSLELAIVGNFASVNGDTDMANMAIWSGTAWSAISTTPLNTTGTFNCIIKIENDYFVGGQFSGNNFNNLAQYKDSTDSWNNLHGGLTCNPDAEDPCATSVVYTLSTFKSKQEFVSGGFSFFDIIDFFDYSKWSIVFAALVGAAVVFSLVVNGCFKLCSMCGNGQSQEEAMKQVDKAKEEANNGDKKENV